MGEPIKALWEERGGWHWSVDDDDAVYSGVCATEHEAHAAIDDTVRSLRTVEHPRARAEGEAAGAAHERERVPTLIAIPPCLSCGETTDLLPVVELRYGFLVHTGASYQGNYECSVCGARGPRGIGPTPDAAIVDALTSAVQNAACHRAWVEALRPRLPHET